MMAEMGPLTVRLRLVWTCSDFVKHEHRWYWTARLCGWWQRLRRGAS